MTSTLSLNWLTMFCQKTHFLVFCIMRFCLNFTSMWSKYPSNNVWRDFRLAKVSISNGNIKCPIGKSIFAVNLPLKLFRTTVANADTRSQKSLYTLLDTYLGHMLAKFEPNRVVQKVQNFELLEKK